MKYVLTIIMIFILSFQIKGQENLISNPSFEEYFDCDFEFHDKLETILPDWYALRRSPYYIRENCSVFENPNFATNPQDGNGFLTAINSVYLNSDSLGHQGRMYFQNELKESITPNSSYYLSFYIAPGSNKSVSISHLGVNFTNELELDPYYNNFPHFPYLQTPTLEIDTIIAKGSSFGEWQKVDWCFTPDTTSSNMQVGYFSPIDSIKFDTAVSGNINFTAYDNFELYEVPLFADLLVSPSNTICAGECLEISTNHSLIPGSFVWTIQGGDIEYSDAPSINVCFSEEGIFDIALNIEHCSVTIDTIFENAITVVAGIDHSNFPDTIICPNTSITIDLSHLDEDILWDNNSEDKIRILEPGNYSYTLDNGYCLENYTLNVLPFFQIQEINTSFELCAQDTFWNGQYSITQDTLLMDTIRSSQFCDSIYIQNNIVFYIDHSISLEDIIQCSDESTLLNLPDYMENIFINNEAFSSPDYIDEPGIYYISWQDENNCAYSDTIEIITADSSTIVTNDLIDIELANDLQILPEYNGNIVTYFWEGPGILSCYDCPYPFILSGNDGIYTVQITDEFNCTYAENIFVQFIKNDFYIANSFSPNSLNSANRRFYLQSTYDVSYSMSIYDRWGNLIYKNQSLQSNQMNEGWLPGNKYNPQVFSYIITIQDVDQEIKKVGTITLLK